MDCIQGILLKIHLLQLVLMLSCSIPVSERLTSELTQFLQTNEKANIVVTFNVRTPETLAKISTKIRGARNRIEKLTTISDALDNQAKISQKKALEIVQDEKVDFRSFWITNQLYVPEASGVLIDKLVALDEVLVISQDERVETLEPVKVEHARTESEGNKRSAHVQYGQLSWGLERIKVPEVWSQGYYGQNVVVGISDSGMDVYHDALRDSFVGLKNHGWHDGANDPMPNDYKGHGTHVLGTILGHNGIGVAPGARWMACRILGSGAMWSADVVECLQHFLCPGDSRGNRDCSKSPHVINNSHYKLGGSLKPGSAMYNIYQAILAFEATDTFLVYCFGNAGPQCETSGYPAAFSDVFSVGSTNYLNKVSDFSSSGPGYNETVKPEVVAPGEKILSSFLNNQYQLHSGTSMATPQVVGVVALMLSKNPSLSRDEIWNILIKSTEPVSLEGRHDQCTTISLDKYPNYRAGYGMLNALKAINMVKVP